MNRNVRSAAVCLSGFILAIVARGADFTNLNFESAVIVPVSGNPYNGVEAGPALPGWTCYTGPYPLTVVNYDNENLDSAGVTIFNTNGFQVLSNTFQGRYTVLLQAGFLLGNEADSVSTAIAQTGVVPSTAQILTFEAQGGSFTVSFAGQTLPAYELSVGRNAAYFVYGAPISSFAGQTNELRFTIDITPPPYLPINNFYLDDIQFTSPATPGAPVILDGPQYNYQSVNAGSNVTFAVLASGLPAPAYQWYFNTSNPLPGATNALLNLTNAQFIQSGSYAVVIANAYGSVTSQVASLTVLDPYITSEPASQTNDAGQTVSFRVGSGGTQPQTFQWLKNGAILNDGGNISGAQTAVLTLANVVAGDAGAYSAIVSNTYSSVTSYVARLTVLDPFITSQPMSQTEYAGQTAVFSVGASGTQPMGFLWLRNSAPLTDGGKVSGSQTAILTLTNVGASDAGGYSVIVSNAISSVTSAVATLTVEDPFISQPTNQTVNAGGTASFSVVAVGSAPLNYQWFDVGTPLSDGGNVSGSQTATLTLSNVWTGDPDGYYAVIADTFGSVTSQMAFVDMNPPTYSILQFFGNIVAYPVVVAGRRLYGAVYSPSPYGGGVNVGAQILRANIDGTGLTVLHNFTNSETGTMGMILSSNTTLYGSYGTVFKINTDGTGFAVLANFSAGEPQNLLLSGGTLYGLTEAYGTYGTLFRVNTDGSGYSVIVNFSFDTGAPNGLVISGTTLYGITSYNANSVPLTGSGTLFRVNTDGSGYTVLQYFYPTNQPTGGIVLSGTTLYGTCFLGAGGNSGAVFRMNTDGSGFAVLKTLTGGAYDGSFPNGGLLLNGSTLYGATLYGGISNNGVVYQINTNGSYYKVLKRFRGNDGTLPAGNLVLSGNTLYGVAGNYSGDGNYALSLMLPTAANINAATLQNQPLNLPLSKFLAAASEPNGAPLTVTGVSATSTSGGSVVLGPTQIGYTPPAGYAGPDRFTYTVGDGQGGFASAFVFVQVLSTNPPSAVILPPSATPGGYVVNFAGIPGQTYSVQRAQTVSGPWVTLSTATVDPYGIGSYPDTNAPVGAAFYRTTFP